MLTMPASAAVQIFDARQVQSFDHLQKSDVYSFGLLLHEIYTRKSLHKCINIPAEQHRMKSILIPRRQSYLDSVRETFKRCPWREIMAECLDKDPEKVESVLRCQ